MIYNLSKAEDREKFILLVNSFYKKNYVVELKKHHPKRTLPQNKYLHLLFGIFGACLGYEVEYVKQELFKKQVNKELFQVIGVNKFGKKYHYYRSTKDLNTAEMTTAIERFRNYSAQEGLYLPEPNEEKHLLEAEQLIERNKEFL